MDGYGVSDLLFAICSRSVFDVFFSNNNKYLRFLCIVSSMEAATEWVDTEAMAWADTEATVAE